MQMQNFLLKTPDAVGAKRDKGKLRIAILLSGKGSNSKAIINACEDGWIDGEVVLVGSDNPGAEGLAFASEKGIKTFLLDYATPRKMCKEKFNIAKLLPPGFNLQDIVLKQRLFDENEIIEKKIKKYFEASAITEWQLIKELKKHKVDLLVLAGFMHFLTPFAIDRICWTMNIHPSLLPAFAGTDGYGDTLKWGCKVGGCTVHFVGYGEDSGPIIGQKTYKICFGDTLKKIKKKGLKNEWKLYPKCIQLFATSRLNLIEQEGGRWIVDVLPEK